MGEKEEEEGDEGGCSIWLVGLKGGWRVLISCSKKRLEEEFFFWNSVILPYNAQNISPIFIIFFAVVVSTSPENPKKNKT